MHHFSWLLSLLVLVTQIPLGAQVRSDPATTPMPDAVTAAVEQYRPRPILWRPCPENAALECGTLTLPVDYTQPRGETFDMAVIRARAVNPGARIGTLILNNGGPAASGVDFVLAGVGVPAFEGLRAGFDIVSFDVRGSHRSRPVRCDILPTGEPPAGDGELVAFLDAFSQRFAQTCVAQNSPFIRTMSTNTIARDMDVLRHALRETQISYVGLSFGTELGAVYASLFPKRVRAMVLDAGIRPDFRDGLVEFASEQTISFELTLHRLDQLCREDAACRLHEGGVVAALDAILGQLATAPVTAPDGTILTARHVRSIVASLLSVESAWPLIVRAVADAQGGDYTLFFQLIPAISTVPLSNTAFFAIKCNDFGTRRSAAEYLPVSEAVGAVTPRLHDRLQVASVVSTCAAWPAADVPTIRPVQQRLDNPLLIVGNDFDPNTPLSWTRSLAAALGAEHGIVRYQGGGHTIVTRATPCIGGIVSAYLFNLVIPEEGTTCPARPINFAPQLESSALQGLAGSWDTPWQQVAPLPAR